MTASLTLSLGRLLALAAAALVATSPAAHAAGLFADQDVDPRFKTRIMKEKARQNQQGANLSANSFNFTQGAAAGSAGEADCGSQNIGNVNTGGRPGTAPRQVFVFAPNAINLVSGAGCK